jgi:hypothetical protein
MQRNAMTLRSKKVDLVYQEVWGLWLAYNVIRWEASQLAVAFSRAPSETKAAVTRNANRAVVTKPNITIMDDHIMSILGKSGVTNDQPTNEIVSTDMGFKRGVVADTITTVNMMLSGVTVNIWEFADAIIFKPGLLPSTWDWTPATAAASEYVKNQGGGWVHYPAGSYPHSIFVKLHSVSHCGDGSSATYITALPASSTVPYGLIEIEAGAVSSSHMVGMHIMGSAVAGFAQPVVNATQWGMYVKAKWDAAYTHGGLWYSEFRDVRVSNFNYGVWTRGGYTTANYQRPIQFVTFNKVFIQVPNGGEALRMTGQHGQIEFNGGAAEGRDGAVALKCINIDWDPDPSTMADNASGQGESTSDVSGAGNAVQSPYNVNFSNGFSIQKSQTGIYARNCRQISVRGAWIERIGKLAMLGTNGRLLIEASHLANAADGTLFSSGGSGYLYSLGTNAYLEFRSSNEPIGTFDNYLDPLTNLNNILGLKVEGMASGNSSSKFKAAGFKTITLSGVAVDLAAHKFATINPNVGNPSIKLVTLTATAAPGESVSLRPLSGPVTLSNTGNISLNGLSEVTIPQNGVVVLQRIPQVIGLTEWVLVSCTPSFGSEVPADGGYYTRGFTRLNTTPTAGNPMGWVCITAGLAGTTAVFKAMSNLSA